MNFLFGSAIAFLLVVVVQMNVFADEKTHREGETVITFDQIGDNYAIAIAKIVESARTIAREDYGYRMPASIRVSITSDPKSQTWLFNDGADYISLTVRSERDLRKPASTGIFHIYGLCHEVAHLAMYGPIRDRGWMTTAAAEGWAHYLGSRILDDVFKRLGPDLWPDRYDYLADGTKRLKQQIARQDQTDVTVRGAALWQGLREILDDHEIAKLFNDWGASTIDPTSPDAALKPPLSLTEHKEACLGWWKSASPVLISKKAASGFVTRTSKPDELAGAVQSLAIDDGNPTGKQSMAGGGHGVCFETTGNDFYLTDVQIHGARYGSKDAPKDDFVVTVCDEDGNVISSFKRPYSRFKFGQMSWTKISVTPTLVPRKFMIFVEFNPTQKKGVFVSHDGEASGDSYTGLPGKSPRPSTKGDWLIRADIDQLKAIDPLRKP